MTGTDVDGSPLNTDLDPTLRDRVAGTVNWLAAPSSWPRVVVWGLATSAALHLVADLWRLLAPSS